MQVGDYFIGKYLIEKVLGRGGMGTVYLARNINTDRYWAIKELRPNINEEINPASEPNLLKKLDHPALPRLYDIVSQDGRLYMITDYIKGISLDKKLEAEGKIDEATVVGWAIQLCRALEYLHSVKPNPIIYRDIKPSNIMLTDTGVLKLIDFGTAREFKPNSEADTVYIGTRGYAAPEQYGTGQTSAVSDIYSLGITLHHLVTGKSPLEPPYGLEPIRHYDQNLSPELEQIIVKCTQESPSDRYQSASELLEDLAVLRCKLSAAIMEGKRNSTGRPDLKDGECCTRIENCCAQEDGDRSEKGSKAMKKFQKEYRNKKPALIRKNKAGRILEAPRFKRMRTDPEDHGDMPANSKGISTGNKPQVRSFRRQVITVWDNAEFGCELAYTAAKFTGGDILLADLDLLAPKADLILNVGKFPPRPVQYGSLGHSGLDIAIDAADKGMLSPALLRQISMSRKDAQNLYIITGNYRLENYEYYSEDSVLRLIDICYRNFDVTVLLVNRSIYDAYTLAALLKSDINIAAVRGEVGLLREYNSYIAFLSDKQRLPEDKTKFVLFEYDKTLDMSISEVRQASGGNLLGIVGYSRKRVAYRNMKSSYVSHMEKNILDQYCSIHEKLGLIPVSGMIPGLRQLCGSIFGSAGRQKGKVMEG